jgi:hypothetical protein
MEELTWEKYCKQFSKDLYTYESQGRKGYYAYRRKSSKDFDIWPRTRRKAQA